MKKVMLLLTSIALVLVTSIAFSALSTSLAITSEVKFRPLADIRVNAIALNSATGAQIAYESDFSKNTVSSGFTLPSEGSSISYRVRVDNSGDVDYSIYDILKTSSDNGLNVAVSGYNITDVIPAKTSVDLILTYTTSNPSESVINVVNTMDFRKVYHVVYETGTSETIPAQVKYEGIDLTLTNTQPVKNGYTFSKWNTKSDGTGVNYNSGATYGLDEDKTLYARYNLDTYNINYVLNGGTNDANNPNTYTYETPNITLADATKTGYEFKGWTGNGTTTATKNLVLPTGSYGDKTFTAQFADETPPTIDVTNSTGATSYLTTGYNVNAGFDDSTANVTVYINAQDTGSGVSKIEYVYSSDINVPTTGWTETTNGALTVSKGRGGYYLHVRATDGENNTTTVTTKKISVRFRVAYYDDYSKNTNITQSQYFVGTALTTRTPTAVSGYTFDGWYRDTALTTKVVDANTSYIPTTSIRLYGKWIPVNYNITYAMNNGTNSPNNPNSYTIESNNITLEQPTKTLTFKGNPNATSGANATSGTVTIGSDTTAAQTFKGWSGTDLTGDNNVSVTIASGSTGDRDYEAHWTAVAGTLPTVTKTGYTCGWSTSSDGTTIEYTSGGLYPTSAISEGQAATVNLYAVCNPNTYTLTINPNGGTYNSTTSTSTKTMTYDSSNNNDIGVPTRDGYTFDGWYLAVDNKTNQLFDDTGKNTDLAGYFSEAYSSGVWKRDGTATVYAHWSKVISSLTNSITPTSYIYDGTAKTPTPTVIDGETTLTSGTDYTITYTNNTNVGTARATITGANVYNSTTKSYYTGSTTINFNITNAKLTFNVGTCTNTTGTTILYTRKNATKVYTGIKNSTEGTIPTASKTGYTFEGWYTANSGGSKVLNANGTFTGTAVTNYTTSNAWNTVADQVLYARCTPTTYTVTANANGGTIASTTGWSGTGNTSTKTVTYDAAYGTLPTVTKTGYTLNGWTLLPEGYRQVEYIQSTGTQYIDTTIVPTNTLDVRIHYIDTAANNSNYVLGSRRNTGSTVMYAVSGQANTQSISSTFVGESVVYPITRAKNKEYIVTNIVEYDEDNGYRIYGILNNVTDSVTYDGYTAYSQSGITGDLATIKVFAYNSSNIHKGMKLYSLKMWDDGVLVRDFVPCVNESTGKAGLYDLINGTFHGNAASGDDFTVGNDNYITSSTIVETSKNHNIYAHWTINDPSTPTITGGETKVYGANATTLTCTENTTYASGTTKSYSFGYANSNGGTPSNWTTYTTSNTLSVGAEAYVGQRWYSCKVKASDGTQTTSEVVSAAASDAEVTINNATITFDANSCGTISGTSPAYVKKGTTGVLTTIRGTTAGTIASVSKSGYTFNGWYDGNTKVIESDGTIVASVTNWTDSTSKWLITADKTLKASCTINNYEITYAMNNGINNANNPNSYTVEDSITLQAPTKTLTFKGNPNATSGANATSGTVTIGSDTTSAQTFAGWTGSNGNTPQTNVTIASGSTGNKEYTAHWTAVAGTLPTVTKTGYTCGWSTTSDGTTIEYTSGGLYPTSAISEGQAATVNLYAVCNPNTYTLTINPNGGTYNSTTSTSTKAMTYDSSNNNDIGVPTRDGYTFDGWYLAVDNKTNQLFDDTGKNTDLAGYFSAAYSSGVWKRDGTATVYAHWSKVISSLTNSITPTSYIYDGTAKTPTPTVIDGETTLTSGTDYTITYTNNTNVGTARATITGANVYNSTTKSYYTGSTTIDFDINNATITFDANSCGTISGTSPAYVKKGTTGVYTGIKNSTAGTVPTVSQSGYVFNGWYEGNTKVINANGTIVASAANWTDSTSKWLITSNKTLTASCSRSDFTITYAMNNGINNSNNPNSYNVDDPAITLQAPTKTLIFKGNPNATSGANATSGTVTIGSDTTVAQTFAGWTGSNGNTPQANVTIASGSTGNKEYTAHWTATAGNTPTVTKDGYTCGWNRSNSGTTIEIESGELFPVSYITEGQAATVNLYAVCIPNDYTITYNYNNASQITFANGESADTGYIIDWDKDFTINGVWKYGTTAKNYLVIGNYDDGVKTLNIELTTANKFRILLGNGGIDDLSSTTVGLNTNITYAFNWDASTDTYTFTATGTSTNVSMTGTYSMSGESTKTLKIGTRDNRETTSTFTTTTYHTALSITRMYTFGQTLTNPTPVTKPQYEFNGWFTAASGGNEVTGSTPVPSQDTTYYAHWTPNTYQVKFNANGGTGIMENQTFTYDVSQRLTPNAFTRSGYTFIGWTTNASGGSSPYCDNMSVTNLTKTNNGIVNLYAQWRKDTYDVIFDGNGSTSGSMSNQTLTYGTTGTLTANSYSKTGYTYAGWNTNATGTAENYDNQDSMNINGNLIVGTSSPSLPTSTTSYAMSGRWGKTSTALTPSLIDVTGLSSLITKGFNIPANTTSSVYDVYLQHMLVTYDQYYTVSVYAKGSGTLQIRAGNASPYRTETFTLTDTWQRYEMKFIPKSGSAAGTYNARSSSNRTHLYFRSAAGNGAIQIAGVKLEVGESATEYVDSNNQLNLHAKWIGNNYTIGYTMNGGPNPSTKPTSGTYDEDVQISNPGNKTFTVNIDKNGTGATVNSTATATQTFSGWTSTTLGSNAMAGANASSYSAWTGTSIKNTYFKNLKESGTVTMVANWNAANITLPSITKNGYSCKYNTEDDGTGTDYEVGASYVTSTTTNSATLYVVCEAIPYTITYTMNNGTNNANNPASYSIESDAITLQAPTKTLTFKGNPNATSGANATSGTVTIGSDTTAAQTFAGWTGSNGNAAQTNVTIASGSTGNKEYTAHWTAVAPATLPTVTKDGYTCGWNASSTGTTIQYDNSGTKDYPTSAISEGQAATVNLYAVCVPNQYTLTINPQGGTYNSTTSNSSKTMTYDSSNNNDIGVPTRDGYTFDGWYTESDGGTKLFGSNGRNVEATGYWSAAYSSGVWKKTAAVTVYAHWTKNVADLTNSISPESYIYSGTAKCPTATVADGNETLTSGTDYTVACSSNTNVGNATLTITGANVYNSTTKAYYTGTTTINFAINNAKLTFNKGTCSTPSSNTILYTKKGSTVVYTGIQNTVEGTIPTPSKTGFTFDGWYTSNSGGNKVLTSSNAFTGTAVTNYTTASAWNVTANRTLYARCIANTHTLTINPQGGIYSGSTENATKTMTYNSTDNNDIGVPTRDGYTFGGWYTEENGGTQLYGTNGQNVAANGYWDAVYSTGKWVKDSDVTVYAKWTKDLAHETITVTKSANFIYNGNAQGPTVTVTDGETSLASGTFTLSGNSNTDVGLYTITVTGANTYNPDTMAYYTGTNSVDYAINNAKISFNKGDCTAVNGTTPRYTKKGSTVVYTGQRNSTLATIPTGTPDTGSSFQGWYTANNGGGSKVLTSTNEFTGTAVTNYTTASAWDLTANKTLYAHCTPDDHTITYDCTTNGGSGTIAGETANYGDTIDLTKTCTAPSGYTFQGWNTTADTHETLSSLTMGLDSVTLRAIYKKNAAFTATFAANNGATVSPTTASCYLYNNETSCQVTPGTVTVQSGFGHYGFNTASNATAAKDVETNNSNYDKTTNKLSISDSGTWYPITRSTSQYVGTFTVVDTNAATKSGGSPSCYRFNGKESCDITAPALTAKSGYVVLGWSATNGSATAEYASSATITLLGNANFYSVTYYNTVVTITFNRNTTNSKVTRQKPYGGSWSTDATVTSSCNKYNGSTTCNMTSPEVEVLTGYHIVGYNTSASATTSSWNVNTAKDVSSNTTYYAITAGNSYSIKFNSNCPTTASGTMSNLAMTYGTAKNLTANAFSCTGRVFDGWSLNADGTGTAYADEESVSNLTTTNGAIVNLYAKWRYTPPTPTMGSGASKIYGVSATTLTCTENTSYPSGVTKYYSFGYTTSSTGNPSNWSDVTTSNTKTIAADAYIGVRYYYCRVYVSDGTEVSDTVVSSNKATMTLKNATLTFDANGCGTIASGGTSPGYVNTSMTGIYTGITNTTAGVMPSTNKLGYTFTGWYAESGLTTKVVNGDGSINASVANWTGADKKWLLTSDNTLYASCSRDTYTITYALNNGTNNANNPSTYHVESSAITIQAPTKTLTFKGNYNTTSGANAANGSGVTIGSNTTKAQTFAGWTGTGLNANTNPVTIPTASTGNRTYTAHWTGVTGATPTVTRTGYTCGWNTSSSGTTRQMESGANYNGTITEGMSATVNLYAVCTPKQYTVNYLCGSGTTGNPPASATATYDQSFTVSTTAGSCDKSGYSFAGWEDPTGGNWTNWSGTWEFDNGQYSVTNNTLTLTAKWAQKSSVITLNNGNQIYGLGDRGNTVSENMTYSINNGIITVTANTTDGFGFTNGEVYLEANKTYTFNCNTNGTWGGNGSDTVEAYLMLNKQYNTYYHMDSNNNYQFTPTVSGKYALRLDVNQSGATHTFSNISIVQNNNANSTTKTMTYDANTNNDIGVPTRAGFTFHGWYTAPIGGTQLYGSNGRNVAANGYWSAAYSSGVWKHDGDLTVYAHWAPKTYTVSYSCGTGATGTAPSSATAVYGETFTIATGHGTCAKANGYSFDGWKDPTGGNWTNWSGRWEFENGQFSVSNNALSLQARWTGGTEKVIFNYNQNQTYGKWSMMDTYYKPDWSKSFDVDITFNPSTSGARYMLFGNYDKSDTKAIQMEVTSSNKFELWVGSSSGHGNSINASVSIGSSNTLHFAWNASTKVATVVINGVSYNFTENTLTGTSARNLRIGNLDYREGDSSTYPFQNNITITDFKISEYFTSPLTSAIPVPDPAGHYKIFDGWTGNNGNNPQYSKGVPAGTDTTVTYNANWHTGFGSIVCYASSGYETSSNQYIKYWYRPCVVYVDKARRLAYLQSAVYFYRTNDYQTNGNGSITVSINGTSYGQQSITNDQIIKMGSIANNEYVILWKHAWDNRTNSLDAISYDANSGKADYRITQFYHSQFSISTPTTAYSFTLPSLD